MEDRRVRKDKVRGKKGKKKVRRRLRGDSKLEVFCPLLRLFQTLLLRRLKTRTGTSGFLKTP